MLKKYLFGVLLFHCVLSDDTGECVRYYFEDYDDLFTRYLCGGRPIWTLGSYDNSEISAPNEKSKWFIKPSPSDFQFACTSSFPFTIMPGGLVEARVYLETTTAAGDGIVLYLMQITETGNHLNLGSTSVYAATGWQVIRVTNTATFTGNPPFQGYIRFMGLASEHSVIIVDSFRYVPSSMEPAKACILYEDMPPVTTSTTTPTSSLITTPTTTSITTSTATPTTIPTTTTPTTAPTTTPTTDPATTPDMIPTLKPTSPITTPSNNLTNYIVEELVDFRKSIRILKKRITKVGHFNELEQPLLGLE